MPFRFAVPLGVLTVSSALALGLLPVCSAFAAGTTTTTVAQAQQQLDAVSVQADQAVEAYDEASDALATVTANATAAKAAAAQEQSVVDAAKVGVQALAVARYEGSSASPALAVLLSNDPTTFLRQTEVLQQVSHYQTASLTDVVNANRVMAALQASADQAVAAQQSALAKLAATKAAVEKVLSQQTALLTAAQAKAAHDAAVAASAAETAAIERQRTAAVSRSMRTAGAAVGDEADDAPQGLDTGRRESTGRESPGRLGQGRQDPRLRLRPAEQALSLRRRGLAGVRLLRSGDACGSCCGNLARAFGRGAATVGTPGAAVAAAAGRPRVLG